MLQAINNSNLADAITLLGKGFPKQQPEFWRTAIDRLNAAGGNATADVPIGYLMLSAGKPVGVVLTPARVQTKEDGTTERVVNLSSWYVDPEERWRAPMMLQQLLRLENTSFTDLTPNKSVQEILKAFGFEQINSGVSVNLLPYMRLMGRRQAQVIPLSQVPRSAIGEETHDILSRYQQFGCVVGALIEDGRHIPLAFKRVLRSKIPLAMLVYSRDNSAVYRNLGAIGRYLAKERIHILMLDIPPGGQIPGIARNKRGNKFARGIQATNQTDFLGTELSLFDW